MSRGRSRGRRNPSEPVAAVEAASAAAQPKGEAKPGVVTTGDELKVANIGEGWVKELRPNREFGFRDGKGYFTLHQHNLRKWFARFGLAKKPGWVALWHVKPEEARTRAPGLDVTEGSSFGDVRIAVPAMPELYKLRSAVMATYEREAGRVGEDPADADAR